MLMDDNVLPFTSTFIDVRERGDFFCCVFGPESLDTKCKIRQREGMQALAYNFG